MATATKHSRANRQVARRAAAGSESVAITFLVFEDTRPGEAAGFSGETVSQ